MNAYRRIRQWMIDQIGKGKSFPNRNKLAESLDVSSPSQLYQMLNEDVDRVPKAEAFLDWADKMGVKVLLPDEWERLGEDFYPVPRVKARLSGGCGSLEVEDEIDGFYAFKFSWLRRKASPSQCVMMSVVGDSMSPTLCNGDSVLVDQSQKEIMPGKIYAVGIEESILVKRLEKMPHKLVVISDNPSYHPQAIPAELVESQVRVIGRVIWGSREF